MDPDRKLEVFGVALLTLIIGAGFWHLASPRLCAYALVIEPKSRDGCFEFWLNRYQTLLGGAFTLAGAGLAAFFVVRQTRVARQQLSVMLGEVDPDFYLFRAGTGMGYVSLQIRNENRLPLTLTEATIMTPADLRIYNVRHPDTLIATIGENGRRAVLQVVVNGARPSAPQVKIDRVDFLFAKKGAVTGTKISLVRLKLSFNIQGGRTQHTFVETRDATVGAEFVPPITVVPY